jgi:hypothetical protein
MIIEIRPDQFDRKTRDSRATLEVGRCYAYSKAVAAKCFDYPSADKAGATRD